MTAHSRPVRGACRNVREDLRERPTEYRRLQIVSTSKTMTQTQPTWVSNPNSKEFVDYIADNFDGVITGLVANGISDEQAATRQSCGASNFEVIFFEIW